MFSRTIRPAETKNDALPGLPDCAGSHLEKFDQPMPRVFAYNSRLAFRGRERKASRGIESGINLSRAEQKARDPVIKFERSRNQGCPVIRRSIKHLQETIFQERSLRIE